jgi:hypothetical protein
MELAANDVRANLEAFPSLQPKQQWRWCFLTIYHKKILSYSYSLRFLV